ncbi:hypothetical protein GS982_20030 [Rhodococcus hoagii]|nr:hypothetical protein [Prescottella equi]NKZ84492.1 hypothetical protein [Prescottella equi]
MSGRWVAGYDEPSNEVHVTPVNDLVAHEASGDCLCGPTTEPIPRPDGSMGWLVSHHSLDGRETRE